jgi:hypothetical protein
LWRVLNTIQPNSPEATDAKQKLDAMLNAPITMIWMDEKAPPDQYGHPTDMISFFSLNEKKDFSKVICERMFYDWSCDRLYMFLDMNADVRNSKVRFVAKTEYQPVVVMAGMAAPPPAKVDPSRIFTLARLFDVSGYNPWNDSYKNAIETTLNEELSF